MLVALAAATEARADIGVSATAKPTDSHLPAIGIMTGLGVPDGASASLAVRPVRALRFELGAAHNGVGAGVRGGLTLVPFKSWFTPVIGVVYGHFFERDANKTVRLATGDATFDSPLLDKVGYDFAAARAGIELGRKRCTFFLHAGIARTWGEIHNFSEAADSSNTNSMITITSSDPHVTVWSVSADLGFVFYL
jgi:hypothetical protein